LHYSSTATGSLSRARLEAIIKEAKDAKVHVAAAHRRV
jgi:hypothetical protein